MKELNLVEYNISDIKYKVNKFPDGQHNITITSKSVPNEIYLIARLNHWIDLELISCAAASLRGIGVKNIHLCTPYFMGARSDRKFEKGGNNYLRDVITPAVNSLGFASINVLDAHSNCLEMAFKNYTNLDNRELVDFALEDIYPTKYK